MSWRSYHCFTVGILFFNGYSGRAHFSEFISKAGDIPLHMCVCVSIWVCLLMMPGFFSHIFSSDEGSESNACYHVLAPATAAIHRPPRSKAYSSHEGMRHPCTVGEFRSEDPAWSHKVWCLGAAVHETPPPLLRPLSPSPPLSLEIASFITLVLKMSCFSSTPCAGEKGP